MIDERPNIRTQSARAVGALAQIRGFSLIEMIIFIIIIGILSLTILAGMNVSLEKGVELTTTTQALFLGQQRIEVISGYKKNQGFAQIKDPCVTAPLFPNQLCSTGAFSQGFTITSTITPNWQSDAALTRVLVNVSGNGVNLNLTTVLGNFE